ncbi:sensor histidine kinase [Ancylobacter mangrovi]|uniref:sensor histidine kinase n=1 Tax=Ancylobacter mangrovi TaxID=2972472 RepID=UPI0021630E88|nr:histidine kinase dimerization/phosphoacceptor domain -containing protein [Ancylobacter mangrovi]MCS0502386.1 DUF4118 domain-containing protein [Ancylobacter mangrovi]
MAEPAGDAASDTFFWRLVRLARPLREHPWRGDAAGVAMFGAALLLRFALEGILPPGFPFLTFFPAVILTTFFCGLRPGITCAALSTLAAWHFFIGPSVGMRLDNGQALMALAFFVGIAALDIVLIHFTFTAADTLRAERETSARLNGSLRIMFQELQHRVANNMQFVAALLTLHRRQAAADPNVALTVLDDAGIRLETIARIHRRLYAPEQLDMPTGQYLRELCRDLIEAAGAREVTCTVEAPDLRLRITQLTTLSMLVAEIVTNSLKHAFAPGQPGLIDVAITPLGAGRYDLAITDDGRGIPVDFDPSSRSSLGFRIIQGLAAQLGGTLRLEGGSGTAAHVEFVVE